ncbi:hypothetical protein PHPALM_27956 [Phytophthora palmivora]|uniref:ATP-binding cassette (ABC) Superfamily n=1 Tax=Phytophthora palmivora TaxID=4796 RepID=A0A2P4XBA5_9STRA|nr:hypothetical protein PHPALM_27956 [Phytophthora palmivora]
MEGQQSKSSAQDERGYGSVNLGTVYRKAAKKTRTTYAPVVVPDPRSQRPSDSQPGIDLPAPTSSVMRGIPATSLAAGASQSAVALGRPAPHGSGARRSGQGGQEELSHAFEYEAPSQPFLLDPQLRVGTLSVSFEIEIALGLGPGGQAASQAGKPGALEVLRRDLNALGRETHGLHGRVDRRVSASALKELRRGLDALTMSSYPSSSHSVPSYPSYDSRGYQPVYQSQAPTPAAPVVQRTQPRFEEVSSHLGLPPSEKEDPADRDTV